MKYFYRTLENQRDEYGRHHHLWFAINGKSAQENYMIQREEMNQWICALQERKRAIEQENEITDLNINIKTVVK